MQSTWHHSAGTLGNRADEKLRAAAGPVPLPDGLVRDGWWLCSSPPLQPTQTPADNLPRPPDKDSAA